MLRVLNRTKLALSSSVTLSRNILTRNNTTGRYKFTEDHEWVEVSGKVCKFGITDYAQKALGDVVFIEVPTIGDKVNKNDQIGAVESVKAASDIYSPVSGTVVEINGLLEEKPSLINTSPFEDGWIAKIEVTDTKEFDKLMDEAAYAKFTE